MVSTAAFHARVRGSVPGLGGLKETKLFLPHPRVKVSIVGSLRDREVACSASDRQGLNFESCVWRTVSSQSSHHPQEVLLAQFSLYVHKGGLKPDSFHFHYLFLLCAIRMKYAYNVMFHLRTLGGECHWLENITSSLVLLPCLSVSQHLSLIDDLFRPCENYRQKTINVNCIFHSSDFRDFLEKHLQVFTITHGHFKIYSKCY